jgi:hypothetical protein
MATLSRVGSILFAIPLAVLAFSICATEGSCEGYRPSQDH